MGPLYIITGSAADSYFADAGNFNPCIVVRPCINIHTNAKYLRAAHSPDRAIGRGVVDVRHGGVAERVGVDELDGVLLVVPLADEAPSVVVEEPHREAALLPRRLHLPQRVVGVPLLPSPRHEASLVVPAE